MSFLTKNVNLSFYFPSFSFLSFPSSLSLSLSLSNQCVCLCSNLLFDDSKSLPLNGKQHWTTDTISFENKGTDQQQSLSLHVPISISSTLVLSFPYFLSSVSHAYSHKRFQRALKDWFTFKLKCPYNLLTPMLSKMFMYIRQKEIKVFDENIPGFPCS